MDDPIRTWIQSLVDCLEQSTLAHPRLDEALSIKQDHLPKHIYKYRRDCNFSRDNLKTNTVWRSSPDSYNDPYDCSFTISEERVIAACQKALIDKFMKDYQLQDVISAGEIEKAKSSDKQAIADCISTRVISTPGRSSKEMTEFMSKKAPRFENDAISFLHQVRKAQKSALLVRSSIPYSRESLNNRCSEAGK